MTMANLRQNSVNASKCKIYDKNANMLQNNSANNIHDTHITMDILFPLMKSNHIHCLKLKNRKSLLLALVTKFHLQDACQVKRWTSVKETCSSLLHFCLGKYLPNIVKIFTQSLHNIYPSVCYICM